MNDPMTTDTAVMWLRRAEAAEAEVERLRLALNMAIYHADNLRRYIDHEVVRDLDESHHGLQRARDILEASA